MATAPVPKRGDKLRLTVTSRAIKELGLVYRDPHDALRELIQNAVDANANTIYIRYDKECRQLVFEHDGEPIEGEYLKAFLTIGTDFKARNSEKYIGMYGIGRLSWLMLGHTAEIITGKYHLVWTEDNIDEISVKPLKNYYDGVKWIIHVRENVDISEYSIERYLRETYYGNIPIYLNNKPITTSLHNAELIFKDMHNEVYFSTKIYDGVIIKDIFAVDREYRLLHLIIKTTDPRVKINPARGVVWDDSYKKWRSYIAQKVLETIVSKYSPGEALKKFGEYFFVELVETAYTPPILSSSDKLREVLRKRIEHIPFKTIDNTYVWGKVLNPRKWVYTDLEITDTTRAKLKNKGINIIYVSRSEIMEWLTKLGFKHVKDRIIEEEGRVITESVSEKIKEVYKEIETIVRDTIKSCMPREETTRHMARPSDRKIVLKGDVVEIVPSSNTPLSTKIHTVKAKIIGELKGLGVYFVDYTDKNTVAFTDGWNTFINVNNDLVKRLVAKSKRIRSKRKLMLLWAPILVHEELHKYGLDHTDPEWHSVYEDVVIKIILTNI